MPRYIPAIELLASEYEALPRRPIVLNIPPTTEPVQLRISVERVIRAVPGATPLPANGKHPPIAQGKAELRCPHCNRTDFSSLRSLNGHIAYETGKRGVAGAALLKRKQKRKVRK
jgi:hypothetical protein